MTITMMERSFSFAEVALQCNVEDEHFSRKSYHRYCKCALHSLQNKTHHYYNCSSLIKRSVGFPLGRVWSETSLILHSCTSESPPSPTSATRLCHPPKPRIVKSYSSLHVGE
ncbi:hypothetical protein SUGI_0891530 [Cryptomeria japonica]|nr:hypothetical protein SUGI_0891530 [Cryptomeria japonica]